MPSVMSASRPAALMRGPSAKPKSNALARRGSRAAAEQRGDAGLHAAGAHPLQTLRDQAAVVGVEPDDVGDGAERDQVEQRVEARLVLGRERAAPAQLAAQREQHVEHHADAREALARESRRPAGSG
jgi:hypothetical protein